MGEAATLVSANPYTAAWLTSGSFAAFLKSARSLTTGSMGTWGKGAGATWISCRPIGKS